MNQNFVQLVEEVNGSNVLLEGWVTDWVMPSVHSALDVAGLVPGLGEPFDAINGVIYAVEGDYINSGLSFAAMIPVVGDSVKVAGRLTMKATKATAKATIKDSGKIVKSLQKIESTIPKVNKAKLAVGSTGKVGKVIRLMQDSKIGGYSSLVIGGVTVLVGVAINIIWKYRTQIASMVTSIIEKISNFSKDMARKIKNAWDSFFKWLQSNVKTSSELTSDLN